MVQVEYLLAKPKATYMRPPWQCVVSPKLFFATSTTCSSDACLLTIRQGHAGIRGAEGCRLRHLRWVCRSWMLQRFQPVRGSEQCCWFQQGSRRQAARGKSSKNSIILSLRLPKANSAVSFTIFQTSA